MALSGYTRNGDCGRKPSSIASLKIALANDLASATYDGTAKNFSALTMETGQIAKEYQFKAGEAEFSVDAQTENGVTKFVSNIVFRAEKMSDKTLEMVSEFADNSYCGMVAEVETFYGERYLVGYDQTYGKIAPLELSGAPLTSGRTLTGEQGGDITLVSETPNRPRLLADGVTLPLTV